ncbi:unnamed protein product [Brassicogethes aeneus]|uniref:MULE transposase domain-containing protein n=1 Tax=Brassicogethes aeneus TaxID=1431903 RepID=A0A9P0BGN3_BRAAE|nr:unnamed protein product [Brassicogethes aeneus]
MSQRRRFNKFSNRRDGKPPREKKKSHNNVQSRKNQFPLFPNPDAEQDSQHHAQSSLHREKTKEQSTKESKVTYKGCKMEHMIGFSSRNRVYLDGLNYMYFKDRTINLNSYFKCAEYRSTFCPARVIKRGNILVQRQEHNHEVPLEIIEELRFRNYLRDRAFNAESLSSAEIFREAEIRFPLVAARSGSLQNFRNLIYRSRALAIPRIPHTTEQFAELLEDPRFADELGLEGRRFFRKLIPSNDNGGNTLLFISPTIEQLVTSAPERSGSLHVDGTFKVTPRVGRVYQLLTIFIFKHSTDFPFAFALMERKNTSSYVALFRQIVNLIPNINPVNCLTDYEEGLRRAIAEVWPNCRLKGCWFHYCQAVFRKSRTLGLQYPANDEKRALVKMAMALPLLPAARLQDGVWVLQNLNVPGSVEFMNYIRIYWLPRDVSIWREDRRTNNLVESFHRDLFRIMGRQHPNCWHFINYLRKAENSKAIQRRRYVRQDQRIARAQDMLEEGGNLLSFLRYAAHGVDSLERFLRPFSLPEINPEDGFPGLLDEVVVLELDAAPAHRQENIIEYVLLDDNTTDEDDEDIFEVVGNPIIRQEAAVVRECSFTTIMPVPSEPELTEDQWDSIDLVLIEFTNWLEFYPRQAEEDWNSILNCWNFKYCAPFCEHFRDFQDQCHFYYRFLKIVDSFYSGNLEEWQAQILFTRLIPRELFGDDYPRAIVRGLGGGQSNSTVDGITLERRNEHALSSCSSSVSSKHSNRNERFDSQKNVGDYFNDSEESDENNEKATNPARFSNYVRKIHRIIKKRRIIHEIIYLKAKKSAIDMLENALKQDQWLTSNCSSGIETTSTAFTTAPTATQSANVGYQQLRSDRRFNRKTFWNFRLGIEKSIWVRSSEIGGLSKCRNYGFAETGMVEIREDEGNFPDPFKCGPNENDGGQTSNSSGQNIEGQSNVKSGSKENKLIAWLREQPTSPILNILTTTQFYNSKFVFWNMKLYKNNKCFEIFAKSFADMSTREIFNYASKCKPLYHANNGPPNSGKNYFMDAVIHFYFNFGQVHNFNKYDQFPLMECWNRRINYWNEPSCEPASFETLKMLFGGDPCPAKIKYESDKVIMFRETVDLTQPELEPELPLPGILPKIRRNYGPDSAIPTTTRTAAPAIADATTTAASSLPPPQLRGGAFCRPIRLPSAAEQPQLQLMQNIHSITTGVILALL